MVGAVHWLCPLVYVGGIKRITMDFKDRNEESVLKAMALDVKLLHLLQGVETSLIYGNP